jgi:hypothetical protein
MVSMQKRKLPRDANLLAAQIVAMSTGQPAPGDKPDAAGDSSGKNPAAVALGKLGGLKGGKARAAALSKKQRAEIAKLAAAARWKKG